MTYRHTKQRSTLWSLFCCCLPLFCLAQQPDWQRLDTRVPLRQLPVASVCGQLYASNAANQLLRSPDGKEWSHVPLPIDSSYLQPIEILITDTAIVAVRVVIGSGAGDGNNNDMSAVVYRLDCADQSWDPVSHFFYRKESSGGYQENGRFRSVRGFFVLAHYRKLVMGTDVFLKRRLSYNGQTWLNAGSSAYDGYADLPLPKTGTGIDYNGYFAADAEDQRSLSFGPDSRGAAHFGGQFYAVGQAGQLWRYDSLHPGSGLPLSHFAEPLYGLGATATGLFVATQHQLYTTDTPADSSSWTLLADLGSAQIASVRYLNGQYFVALASGSVIRLTSSGASLAHPVITDPNISQLIVAGDSLLVWADGRSFSLTAADTLRPLSASPWPLPIQQVSYSDGRLWLERIGNLRYLFFAHPDGAVDTLLSAPGLSAFHRRDSSLLLYGAQTYWESTDFGAQWSSYPSSTAPYRQQLYRDSLGHWVIGRYGNEWRYSTDQGINWMTVDPPSDVWMPTSRGLFVVEGNSVQNRLWRWSPLLGSPTLVRELDLPLAQSVVTFDYQVADRLRGDTYWVASYLYEMGPAGVVYSLDPYRGDFYPVAVPGSLVWSHESSPVHVTRFHAGAYQYVYADERVFARTREGVFVTDFCPTQIGRSDTIRQYFCEGDTLLLDNQAFSSTSTYVAATETNGCVDSVRYELIRVDSLVLLDELSYCRAEPYLFFDQLLDSTGTYVHTAAVSGCPQRTELTFTREEPDTVDIAGSVCPNELFYVPALAYNFPAGQSLYIQSGPVCDTLYRISVDELERPVNRDTIAVPPGTVINGEIITEPTTFVEQLFGQAANGCDSIQYTFVDVLTSTAIPAWTRVRMFPNPVNDLLHLTRLPSSEGRITLRLTDALGRCWRVQTVDAATATLSLAALAPGIYTLELRTTTGLHLARRLMKQ